MRIDVAAACSLCSTAGQPADDNIDETSSSITQTGELHHPRLCFAGRAAGLLLRYPNPSCRFLFCCHEFPQGNNAIATGLPPRARAATRCPRLPVRRATGRPADARRRSKGARAAASETCCSRMIGTSGGKPGSRSHIGGAPRRARIADRSASREARCCRPDDRVSPVNGLGPNGLASSLAMPSVRLDSLVVISSYLHLRILETNILTQVSSFQLTKGRLSG